MSAAVVAVRRRRARSGGAVVVLLALAIALGVASLCLGDLVLTPGQVFEALARGEGDGALIVPEFRLPRVIGAALVGLGFGMAGAVTQSLLKNPLASPDIVGVTAGASAGAVAILAAGSAAVPAWLAGVPLPLAALGGGLLAGAAVVLLSFKGGLAPHRVILVGLGVNAAAGAVTSWLLLQADDASLGSSLIWLAGSLNEVRPQVLAPVAWVVLVSAVLLLAAHRTLGLLRWDERVARALGVRVSLAQLALLALAVAVAATVTVVGGPVPFVAFVAPQVAMLLLRSEGPPPLASGLVGACAVLASDVVAAHAFASPLPVGVVTAFLGVPFLLWILLRAAKS